MFQHQHLPVSFSDHSLAPSIVIKITSKIPPLRSYWKLNDSILSIQSNLLSVKAFISDINRPHAPITDPLFWWDNRKIKLKSLLIKLSVWTKRKQDKEHQILKKKLEEATSKQRTEQVYFIQHELEKIETKKLKGAEIRSRQPPNTSIDSPSPIAPIKEYTMHQKSIIPTDNNLSPNQFLVFFNTLWNPPNYYPDPTNYLYDIKSSIDDKVLETLPQSPLVTDEEVRLSIQNLNRKSAPGLDGLTPFFYLSFPSLIPSLIQTFNNSYIREELPLSQRQALVKLIPKTQHPTSVRDWRPISLLNTDYKILSSIISNRLKPILNSIISNEQQCGLPTRQIFNNHLNVKSAIDFAKDFSQPLAIIQIDFYKAFDSISHAFILQTASKLGIPSFLLKWIRIFLNNLTAKINFNGILSDSIPVKRGIRQGCPLSMLLFIIGIEPLTRKILSSSKIQGLSLGKTFLKVSHYADDLTLFITHPSSFLALNEILNQFSIFSGLQINRDKTTIISNSSDLVSSFKNSFPQGKILQSAKILGLHFSFEVEKMKQNWDDLIRSAPHSSLASLNPNDSLFSKVISINQHFLPQILFLARIVPPTPRQIRSLTSILFKFIWNFSPFEPIKRSTLYLRKCDGGIALPCLGAKISTAFLWQFIFLLRTPRPSPHFWMKYALYNIGTKILPYESTLYSNSEPHRPSPNVHWKKVLSILSKIEAAPEEISKLSFKSLYLLLLKPEPNTVPMATKIPNPPKQSLSTPHSWLRLALFKPKPLLFSNHEKEVAFRIAYNGYTWGSFFIKHNIKPRNPDDFLCKLCSSHVDSPQHLFYECPPTKYLIFHLQPTLSAYIKQPRLLSKNALLFNNTDFTGTSHLIITKMSSLIRLSILQIRNNIISYHTPITPSMLNENIFKIKTKFKIFLSQLEIPILL